MLEESVAYKWAKDTEDCHRWRRISLLTPQFARQRIANPGGKAPKAAVHGCLTDKFCFIFLEEHPTYVAALEMLAGENLKSLILEDFYSQVFEVCLSQSIHKKTKGFEPHPMPLHLWQSSAGWFVTCTGGERPPEGDWGQPVRLKAAAIT